MELVIGICGIILGIIAGYLFTRTSNVPLQAQIDSLKNTIEEKENHFNQILSEKQRNFDQMLLRENEKASQETNNLKEAYSREIGALKENHLREVNSLKENHFRELESLKENHVKFVDSMEKNHREAMENMEKNYREGVETMELNHRKAMEALRTQFAEVTNSMSLQLKTTTEEMLKQRQEEFSTSSGEKINQILEPLKQSLKAMQEKVNENTTRHVELGGKLTSSIRNLLDHTEAAQASADRLASLLKGSNRHQGEWGERILKEILESLNLKEGIHFDVQHTFSQETGGALKNEDGKMARPDVILHLDENKDVIIDSKVSLSAYLQYQEANSEEERQEALKRHIQSLEKHVSELVKKDYTGYVKAPKMRLGYVIMFVPNTSALLLATNSKPTLWREAMERNVYIADEQTLYAALKIVSLTWTQIIQNENYSKVFDLAEEMVQRVGQFMKYYNDLGEQLTKVKRSYDEGKRKLDEGGQSIPKTCRKLIDLGAKEKKRLGT